MKNKALVTSSLALALAGQVPGGHAQHLAVATQKASELTVIQASIFGPAEIFNLTADFFIRSYFADLRGVPNWGPDHPAWARNLSSFSSEMLRLMLPQGVDLESHLSAELQRQLDREELSKLATSVSRPEFTSAAIHLLEVGASWRSLILVQSVMRAPKLYSSAEREQAKAIVSALRGEVSGGRANLLKNDLEPIASFLNSQAFEKYQAALGSTFMVGAKRLSETPERRRGFESLMQRWHVRLKNGA